MNNIAEKNTVGKELTDEEATALDRARAEEARRRCANPHHSITGFEIAARLAREGWKPEDGLLKEAREIVAQHYEDFLGFAEALRQGECDDLPEVQVALAALRRGMEIEREGRG